MMINLRMFNLSYLKYIIYRRNILYHQKIAKGAFKWEFSSRSKFYIFLKIVLLFNRKHVISSTIGKKQKLSLPKLIAFFTIEKPAT